MYGFIGIELNTHEQKNTAAGQASRDVGRVFSKVHPAWAREKQPQTNQRKGSYLFKVLLGAPLQDATEELPVPISGLKYCCGSTFAVSYLLFTHSRHTKYVQSVGRFAARSEGQKPDAASESCGVVEHTHEIKGPLHLEHVKLTPMCMLHPGLRRRPVPVPGHKPSGNATA